MENASLPSDVLNDVTTSPSQSHDLTLYLANIRDLALKVIYIIIGAVGILDNLFVLIVFILFIKITEKVLQTILQCVPKSDDKIEITITATNLIRIKYPLSTFNYHLSGADVPNFNKIHCTVFEQQLLKNATKQQKFLIWKSRLSSSYAIPSVTERCTS